MSSSNLDRSTPSFLWKLSASPCLILLHVAEMSSLEGSFPLLETSLSMAVYASAYPNSLDAFDSLYNAQQRPLPSFSNESSHFLSLPSSISLLAMLLRQDLGFLLAASIIDCMSYVSVGPSL